MTYCNVLARVDSKHLDEILATFLVRWEAKPRCGAEPSRWHTPQGKADHAHLAIDGKTLGATSSQPHPVHQLNSAVLSFMDWAGVRNVARQMRSFDAHAQQALALVLTGSCSMY